MDTALKTLLDPAIQVSNGIRLAYAMVAIGVVYGLEWLADHRHHDGRTGKVAYNLMDNTPLSLAIYRGLRFVGVCILIAMVLA